MPADLPGVMAGGVIGTASSLATILTGNRYKVEQCLRACEEALSFFS